LKRAWLEQSLVSSRPDLVTELANIIITEWKFMVRVLVKQYILSWAMEDQLL